MQPGYPGSGQDPYGQQPPYSDPYAQPQYPPSPQQPPSEPYGQQPQPPADPYGQPQPPPPYQDPYGQPPQPPYQDQYGQPQPPPYHDPYAQSMPGYGGPSVPPQQNNTLGLVGMILGIASIPFACCYVGLLLGPAGVVLGVLGIRKANAGQASNRGQSLTGIICGVIGFVLSIGLAAVVSSNFKNLSN
jgi:hypothetical protein